MLSQRVQGHPLSIRLLSGRFADESATDLATFLEHIEGELEVAEQTTPVSIEDPERQRTLYACIDYSVKRLTPELRKVLDATSLFQAPFLPEFVAYMLGDEEQTPFHLQNLVRLSLLDISAQTRTFKEGVLLLLELHPILRWYIQHHRSVPNAQLMERYGVVYEQLAHTTYDTYDRDSRLRYLVSQCLPDFESALGFLPSKRRSSLAYHLAQPSQWLGQNRHALDLYEQALEIDQDLGDIHSVAMTQSAMAHVLVQLGKPQEAMALYEQSLHTKLNLGDVRGVAATKSAMAYVLVQLGKPQEAMALYEQVLRTTQDLGDVRGVAATQSEMAHVLRQLGNPQEALLVYEQVIPVYQDLGDVRSVAVTQANFSQLLFQQGQNQHALSLAWEAYTSLHQSGFNYDALNVQRQLISIKVQILDPAHFDALWSQVIYQPQPEWLCDLQAISSFEQESLSFDISDELLQVVRDYINTEEWDVKRQLVEVQQEFLFQPEVEMLFKRNIAQARIRGNQRVTQLLDDHLTLLYACKTIGIAEAFAQLTEEGEALPFDADLIPSSIAALLGGPQKKMEHVQYLSTLASQTTDEDLKALITEIQLALFSKDISQLGRDLKGIYQQAWEAIVVGVESGGVDPRVFDALIHNTLAVLGPAAHQRSEWRNNLVELRNQSTSMGDRNMVTLLDAVIGLLDAGGNHTGLGGDLKGIYAKTWEEIVKK
jgi:tetratricopeptide (TPR) repeat protein